MNRLAGLAATLHMGKRPELAGDENLTSEGYIRAVEKLPAIHVQGDGIRSFVGVLLHALTGDRSLVLVDEPEAFLHPPQARLLGQMLVAETPARRQLFLATHSGDLLRGIISASSSRVLVVRVQRSNDKNPIAQLDQRGVRQLWDDPLLRYSNALDGLFHDVVVICEADADCRFYGAITDAVWAAQGEPAPAVMFTHCGGKHRIPMLVAALHALEVPVRVVIDFDGLQDETPLRTIVETLGALWSEFEADWRAVKASIDSKKPELATSDVAEEIKNTLAKVISEKLPQGTANEIRRILRRSSPWAIAKEAGKNYVPAGTPRQTYDRLVQRLRTLGVHLVEVGELESFDRSIGNHGPEWVNAVIQKNLVDDPSFEEARRFVRRLLT